MDGLGKSGRGKGGRGLVIGAGGVLGLAWIAVTLERLEREEGWDPRDADAIVGTSAGSITAALLGCGFSTADLIGLQRHGTLPGISWEPAPPRGPYPPRPHLRPASPVLAATGLWRTRSLFAAATGVLPRGKDTMTGVRRMIEAALDGRSWAPHPRTCAVAMDLTSGKRVAFGRPDHPSAHMADAVAASCTIPGWFEPVEINGREYVDGGVRSSTNADLLSREGLSEILVVAPMTSPTFPRPRSAAETAERAIRLRMSRRLDHEIGRLEASGTRVRRVEPTLDELDVMGPNFMDPRRRHAVLAMAGVSSASNSPM